MSSLLTGTQQTQSPTQDSNAPNILELMSATDEIAIDTETDRLSTRLANLKIKMRGLSVSPNGADAAYITAPEDWQKHVPEGKTWIFHNAKFDLPVLNRAGVNGIRRFEDTLIAAHLLDENSEHKLKTLARELLGVENPILYDQAEQAGEEVDRNIFDTYARNDARYTYLLWQIMKPALAEQELTQVYELEKQVVPVLIDAEDIGIKVDVSLLGDMEADANKHKTDVLRRISEVAGNLVPKQYTLFEEDYKDLQDIITSNDKLGKLLFDKLGLACTKKTKGGARSVAKEMLAELEDEHEIVPLIQEFREVHKLITGFLIPLPQFLDENNRIHPSFNSLGTVTGRMSASQPNIQQIPARSELGKKMRRAFIPEPGWSLVVADYGQMELRVLASYLASICRDGRMAELLTSGTAPDGSKFDLHTYTAHQMFGVDYTAVEKSQRFVAKMINFGIVYGISSVGLFRRLNAEGIKVSKEECERFIELYFQTYPAVLEYMTLIHSNTKSRGYVINGFKRRRRLLGATERELRQAINYPIQSTSADIVKYAMTNIYRMLPKPARIICQIHDEIIIEAPSEMAEECKSIVESQMMSTAATGGKKFAAPMTVDAAIGLTWGDAK